MSNQGIWKQEITKDEFVDNKQSITIDELIAELQHVRNNHGNIRVNL